MRAHTGSSRRSSSATPSKFEPTPMPTMPGASLMRSSSVSEASTSGSGSVAKPRTRSGLRLNAGHERIVEPPRQVDAQLRLERVDARRVHRQHGNVDALPVHLADEMVGIEHLRAERQPGLAVLEQIAQPVRIDLHGDAGQRRQRVVEELFDLVRVDVDDHRGNYTTLALDAKPVGSGITRPRQRRLSISQGSAR